MQGNSIISHEFVSCSSKGQVIKLTSAVLGTDSQKTSILRSPRSVCKVTDYQKNISS